MSNPSPSFAPLMPHGALREVLPGIYFVTGTVALPTPLPVRCSRNMTVIREGERLVLVNTLRLDDAGLAELDRLGKVTDVIRIAGNHGMDDPFYKDRYGAKVWAVRGQRYTRGFDSNAPETYLTPDVAMDASTPLPLEGARLYVIDSRPPEGILLLERNDGVAIVGDCLQHWHQTDAYFNLVARLMMPLMGFIKAHNVGPAWFKQCKPPKEQLRGVLQQRFTRVLPAHGDPVLSDALERYRPAIERVS